MKKAGILILSFCALFCFCSKPQQPQEKISFDVKVQSVLGDVKIKSATGEKAASINDAVNEGDIVSTGKKSIIDLIYGERGLIRIQENSVVRAVILKEQVTGETQLNLDKGKVFISVSKLVQNTNFKVKTPTTVASVRGTTFRVSATGKSMRLDVLSGKVKINPIKDDKVIETIETFVTENQAVELSNKEVENLITIKGEIPVEAIKPAIKEEIKNEIKDVAPEVMTLIHSGSEKEIEKIIKPESPVVPEDSKDKVKETDERKKKEEQAKLLKEQDEKDKQTEADRIAKEQADKIKQEEEKKQAAEVKKKERASSVPTL